MSSKVKKAKEPAKPLHLNITKKQPFFKKRKSPTEDQTKGLKWITIHLKPEAPYEDSLRLEKLASAIESPDSALGKRFMTFLKENV